MGIDKTEPMPKRREMVAHVAWVDNLRTFVIVLVVNMHACGTYSRIGGWYNISEGPEPSLPVKIAFAFWQAHLQSFFMGILFLIAGYFAHGSIQRRGPTGFIRERLVRLGLPTLFYMLALNPLIVFVINPNGNEQGPLAIAYWRYVVDGGFLGGSGPMWFTAALFLFSAAFTLWQVLRPRPEAVNSAKDGGAHGDGAPRRVPAAGLFWAWGLLLVAATFLVRTIQPIGTSILNMQLCFFPQYIIAFGAGIAAAEGDWLETLAQSTFARNAGWSGLVLGPVALASVLVGGGVLRGVDPAVFSGGWHWAALGYAGWEQLTGLAIGLGAMAFCAKKLNVMTPRLRWISDRSFGVYLFHPPILILFTLVLRYLVANSFFKVSLLTAAGLMGSYLVADLARRLPVLRKIV